MPDVADFAALFSSLKAITDLAKLLIDARDAGVIRAKAIELQREIIATQQAAIAVQAEHFLSLKRVGELEKKVADLKTWNTEKEKYQLAKPSPHSDVFAYVLKDDSGTSEPRHYICPKCYEDQIKSILQKEIHISRAHVLACARCRTDIYLIGYVDPQDPGRDSH